MIAALLALGLAASAAPAVPAGVEVLPRSPRHPEVLLAPRPGPRAALVVRFHAGSIDDEVDRIPSPGLSHFSQVVLLRANARLDFVGLVKDLYQADGDLRVETGLDVSEFRMEAAAPEFPRLAARLLDALFAPSIQGGDPFELARDTALHDRREGRGGTILWEIAHLAVPDPAWGSVPHGDRATLERLDPRAVRAHLARVFTPANATIAFAGAFEPRAARALVARFSGGARRAEELPRVLAPFAVAAPSRREFYLIGFRAREATPALEVLAALLEERVDERFRAAGVGYTQEVEVVDEPWLQGVLLVLPSSPTGPGARAGLEAEGVLADVRAGKFDEADVARNRGHVLAAAERADREPLSLARALVRARPGRSFGAARAEQLRAVDRAALLAVAQETLRDEGSLRILFTPELDRTGPLPSRVRPPGRSQ